jgi:hypothetical protein
MFRPRFDVCLQLGVWLVCGPRIGAVVVVKASCVHVERWQYVQRVVAACEAHHFGFAWFVVDR